MSSKNIIYLKNKNDYIAKNALINENVLIMLNCNLCKSWFHSKCLGFDDKNLLYYFESYKDFCCLDCYIGDKYKDRYLEVTFVKYLEVLKMSYIVMCFSKLIMIILRSISKDSNVKLHSKLLKAYLKENFNTLLRDKNICMLLELIRMDIFLLKDKEANQKKRNLENVINSTLLKNNNIGSGINNPNVSDDINNCINNKAYSNSLNKKKGNTGEVDEAKTNYINANKADSAFNNGITI